MSSCRVSALQTKPHFLNPEQNRNRIVTLIEPLKSDLIVLPELSTSGYNIQTKRELKKSAEKIPQGPSCRLFQALAREKNCSFVVGLPEIHQGIYYNSAIFVTPKSVNRYRKIHLFFNEKRIFHPGNLPYQVYPWKNLRVGILICFDWIFPEVARSLVLKGANLLAHPSNLVLPYAQKGMVTRSLENGVFSITANRVGKEKNLRFTGKSQILDCRGKSLGHLNSNSVGSLTATINLQDAQNKWITSKNHLIGDRKPRFYI